MTRHAHTVGAFEVTSLPSQVQVAVAHAFFVKEGIRGQGYAKQLHAHQLEVLQEHGYDYAICTVTGNNVPQFKALESAGWRLLDEFHNSRVSGPTRLYGIAIAKVGIEASNVTPFKALA